MEMAAMTKEEATVLFENISYHDKIEILDMMKKLLCVEKCDGTIR